MKIHTMEQGSEAWLQARIGLPTASEFDKIVSNTGKLSTQSRKYAIRLVGEIILQRPLGADLSNNYDVQRGNELEPVAADLYAFETGRVLQKVGFVTLDSGIAGASPDRMVGDDGLLEIKCPKVETHIEYEFDGFGHKYNTQTQGQMMVCEREWTDKYSYCEEMPSYVERVFRDEPFIKNLEQALKDFHDMKLELLERARQRGMMQQVGAAA